MTSANNTVSIRILDKDYQVNCPPEEQNALIRSSQLLDARMREIRKSGHVIGLERIAVMAALNLTYDLLMAETKASDNDSVNRDISALDDKLSAALARFSPQSH
ncbi:MAG: cell division protein ZapA [Porticoccaceae bacterium]|jgi:cell division protein ZapA